MSHSRNESIRLVKVNFFAVLALVTAAAAGGLCLYALNIYQERRMDREALAAALRLRDGGDADLAVRNLNQHLNRHPSHLPALRLKADILGDSAESLSQIMEAARVYEQCLRAAPNDPGAQDARRRLVGLYVRYGDTLRNLANTQLTNQIVTLESRFRAAESIARQLIARGAVDSGAHRLLAMSLDGLAVPGDPQAIDGAVQEYRKVLSMDPSDVEASERLARLYLGRLKDPIRAELVFDDLLRHHPDSVEVRLARHRFFLSLRGDERYIKVRGSADPKAAAELDQAIALGPKNVAVLVSAAEYALRRGNIEEARRYLDRVPEASRTDLRVLMTRGMIDYGDERPDEAIDVWRRGLSSSSGTNEQMTWWLAYSLLQMNRIPEARPLITQYRRLSGQDTPLLLLLQAQYDERTGRPARAVTTLDAVSKRLEPQWEGMIQLSRGRCYEALWDEHKALESYNLAMQADPTSVLPRLAIAKYKLRRRPTESVEEIKRGMSLIAGDPALRVALAGSLLQVEAVKPPGQRRWEEFDAAWKDAAGTAGSNSAVAMMRADRLALSGREEEALTFLEEIAKKSPRSSAIAVALADGLNRLNRPAKSIEVIDRASAPGAAGDQASLRIARARALTSLNRGRDARTTLIRDIDKLPPVDRPLVWIALGQLEIARGNADAARLAYDEWARLQPEDPRPRLVLLELAIDARNEAAVRSLVNELKVRGGGDNGGDKDTAYRLGRAKQLIWERDLARPPVGSRDESLEEAGRLVSAVLSDTPELPAAHMMYGQVLQRQGRTGEAIAAYERAWERGVSAALSPLVELLTRSKRFDSLARLRGGAARSAVQVGLLSAQAFLRNGDQTQARGLAEQMARDLPGSPEAASWQARMLNHLGQAEDSESVLRALAERQPRVLDAWLELIKSQAARKRTEAVLATIARVKAEIKLDPPELVEARCFAAAVSRNAADNQTDNADKDFVAAADKAFAAAIAKKPNDPTVRVEAARYYESRGRPLDAEECLDVVLKNDPGNMPVARQLATILASRSAASPALWQRAWAILGAEKDGVGDPEDRFARAAVLYRANDAAKRLEAIERLDTLITDVPASHPVAAPARKLLANLWIAENQPEKAAQLSAVSAKVGGDPDSIALYAQALIQSKKWDDAEWQLDRLAAINPGDQREASLRARLFWDGNRLVESAAAVERAYLAREGTPGAEALGREAFLLLAETGANANPAAQRLGTKLAAKKPAYSWMPAKILTRGSRFDEALGLLMTAARSGGSVEDLRETARAAMEVAIATDDPETLRKVDVVLSACIRTEPNADELSLMLAMLRHIQGDFKDEVRLYKELLAHRPESYVVLNNLAWALSEGLGQPKEALEHIETLVKITGNEIQALDTRGIILGRLGQHEKAILDMEAVVRAEPTPLHHFHLARVYKFANRDEDARRSFELAIKGDKDGKDGITPRDVDPAERPDLAALRKLAAPVGPTAAVDAPAR